MESQGYLKLIMWQKSMELVEFSYALIRMLPVSESECLGSQMRRAVVSIPSNIAEGYTRDGAGEYTRFLKIALGSCAELETQLQICVRTCLLTEDAVCKATDLLVEIKRMLNASIRTLRRKK